jgi:outer membrane protein
MLRYLHIELRMFARISLAPLFIATIVTPIAVNASDLITTLKLAKKADPVFLSAEATYNADSQLVAQARADLLPNVSATGDLAQNDLTVNNNPLNFNSSGYEFSLRQPLFNWESISELKRAKAEVRKAEAQFSAARQELITRVTVLYFDVLRGNDAVTLAKAEQEAISKQLELAKARLEVGLGTITEVHDSSARYELTVAQLIDAENFLQDARYALGEAIGKLPPKLKVLKENVPLLLPDPPNTKVWTDWAQQQNLGLLAAIADVEIARRDLSVKRAGHLPTLDVIGSHRHADTVDGLGANLNTTDNSVKLELKFPIYTGGKVTAFSKEAEYRYQAAIQNMEAVRRNALRTTRDAFNGIKGDVSRVRALKQAVVAGKSALEAKNIGFEAGIETNIDVLNAQRDLFGSKRDYAQSRYSYVINLLRLREAAGTLNIQDLEKVNGWLE